MLFLINVLSHTVLIRKAADDLLCVGSKTAAVGAGVGSAQTVSEWVGGWLGE